MTVSPHATSPHVTSPNVTTAEVLRAYLDCRQHKRGTAGADLFEQELAANCVHLARALRAGEWVPGPCTCFLVTYPQLREIWAAGFCDRVVHHVLHNRLRPRLEPTFIPTSFACIKGRGTLAAKNWAERAARRVSAGWTREAWVLQMDVRSFFPSIDHDILLDQMAPAFTEPWLATAVERVYRHDVTVGARVHGSAADFAKVPAHKSLWHTPPGKGLPIGNLTSQFAANVYLNALDQQVQHVLKPRFYGRYVDDLLFLDPDKRRLLDIRDAVTAFAAERLLLTMHPGKTRLQPVRHGIDFVGYRILPHRTYLRRRTAHAARQRIAASPDAQALIATSNSYLGLARHANTWRLRGTMIAAACERSRSAMVGSPDRTRLMRTDTTPCLCSSTS